MAGLTPATLGLLPSQALAELVEAIVVSPLREPEVLVTYGRAVARALNLPCNPVGANNLKTGVPGTYRPVGPTCPKCDIAAGCYARFGPTAFHARRASKEALPSAVAAAIAMAAAAMAGHPARLHVAGDFYYAGRLDLAYLEMVHFVASLVQRAARPEGQLAWTYTHGRGARLDAWIGALDEVGIRVLRSGRREAGGAIVWPHARLDELPDGHAIRFVPCDAQTSKTTCRQCTRCWSAKEHGECIVFSPHGQGAATLRDQLFVS